MSQNNGNADAGQVSPELDAMSCDLLGSALDALAAGVDVHGVVSVEDARSRRDTRAFSDDGPEACLEGARGFVRKLVADGGDESEPIGKPVRYALVYEGAVAGEQGGYDDALILEFGEMGSRSFSAYVLWDGFGAGDDFAWSDPMPAGEVESLL